MRRRQAAGLQLPKVVYLIPHGQNPSGSTMCADPRPPCPCLPPSPTHAQQQDTLGPRRIAHAPHRARAASRTRRIAHAPKRRKMPIGGTSCSIATLPNNCSRKEPVQKSIRMK